MDREFESDGYTKALEILASKSEIAIRKEEHEKLIFDLASLTKEQNKRIQEVMK